MLHGSINMDFKTDGCIQEAWRLRVLNGDKGGVYFVTKVDGRVVDHAYYVPDEAALDSWALNGPESGFQAPPMRVRHVLELGRKYF